jgi:glutamate synthase (NADPH/NADH) large chain/glutamate synthase (ferredoxin)
MNGGEIIVKPSEKETFVWHENIIMGNTCLYGATGGTLFAAGQAGERFAVRNSGAVSVVEGVGDHCCEYMTGGTIVVLGETGRNFGAGMSGGLAFVYDEKQNLDGRYNPEMVGLQALDRNEEIEDLQKLIEVHHRLTGSPRAREILDNWHEALTKFWRVTPHTAPDVPEPSFTLAENVVTLV